MDAVSYAHADGAHKKISKFVADPRDINGIVTLPKVIQAGSNVTIPTNRQIVVRELIVENGASVTIEGNGEIFVPNGGAGLTLPVMTTDSVKTQTTQKTINTDDIVKQTDGIIQDIDGVAIYADRGLKNKLINGGFDIAQRATSDTSTTSGYITVDRWYFGKNGLSVQTVQSSNDTVIEKFNSQRCLLVSTPATTGVAVYAMQKIEGLRKFSGKQVTVSFNTYNQNASTMTVKLRANFGSGGSATLFCGQIIDTGVLGGYTLDTVSGTITIPDLSSYTFGTDDFLQLEIYFGTDTNATPSTAFYLGNVQLEEGSVATPFEQRPIGLEYELCKRYYRVLPKFTFTASDTANRYAYASSDFAFGMRKSPSVIGTPTLSLGTGLVTTDSSCTVHADGTLAFFYQSSTTSTYPSVSFLDIKLDAEL